MRAWWLTLGLVALGCTSGSGAVGSSCSSDSECGSADGGFFCATRCLEARSDFDFDGLSNAEERALGTDPLTSDTDGDGRPDSVEAMGLGNDADGDGRLDAIESARGDEDGDCIPDQADPKDAGLERDEVNLRRQCRFAGACVNTFPRQRATCVGGVLTCTFDGAAYPSETCNDVDDDCDGVVDEGCADAGVTAGEFLDPDVRQPGDVPGTLVIEKPVKLVVPDGLPFAAKTLELDWVSDFEARCVPRDDETPPLLVMEVVTLGATSADFEVLGEGPSLQRAPRDARGRKASLSANGRVLGTVALEHLAGTWQALSLKCVDANRAGRDVSLTIPVFIKKTGNAGETLPPLTVTKSSSCSTSGLVLLAPLALVWLRRRRAVVMLALLSACGTPPAGALSAGHGATNTQPLWPLGGEQTFVWDTEPLEGRDSTLPFGAALHSQRRVPGGVEHRFDRGFLDTMPGLAVRLDDSGDLFLTATHYGPLEPAVLLVPKQVKVGQSWEVTLPFERDTLGHFIDLPLEYGDGRFRFTVSHRQEVHTRWGRRTLWRIEWVGPPIPHGLTPEGDVDTLRATLKVPTSEQARLRGFVDFVEGSGPVALAPFLRGLDAFAFYGYSNAKQGWEEPRLRPLASELPKLGGVRDGASDLAERVFPPVGDGALELAASSPQDAPTLTATPVSSEPFTESGIMPKYGWLTRSSKESAGELVLIGDTAPFAGFIDPNGNTTGVYFPTATAGCALIDGDGRVVGEPMSDKCPSRVTNGARPYVGPDGTRWDPVSAGKVVAQRSPSSGISGFEPFAPFWRDGVFESVGRTVTTSGSSQLAVRTFGAVPTDDLIDEPTVAGDMVPGTTRFVVMDDVRSDDSLAFARPFGEELAYLQVGALQRLSPFMPNLRPGVALWTDAAGQVLRQQTLAGSRYGWTHVDDTHRLTEMGQLGELRVLHLERDRVWAELLGRVTLPTNHVAGMAFWLGGDRYLVLTQEAPEFRITGFVEDYASVHSLQQKRPSAGRLFAHVVTAPSTGQVDVAWSLRQLSAEVTMTGVRACVPAGSGLTIDALRIGARTLDASEVTTSGDCMAGRSTTDDAARTRLAKWTPLSVHVAGQGWVQKPLPALNKDMMKRSRFTQPAHTLLSLSSRGGEGRGEERRAVLETPTPTGRWQREGFSCSRDTFSDELWCGRDELSQQRVVGWVGVQTLALSGERACGVRGDGTFSCFNTKTLASTTFDELRSARQVWGATDATEKEGRFVIEQHGQWFGLGALQNAKKLGGPWKGPWSTPRRLSQVEGARDVVMHEKEVCFVFTDTTRCFADGEVADGAPPR